MHKGRNNPNVTYTMEGQILAKIKSEKDLVYKQLFCPHLEYAIKHDPHGLKRI
jgi:hypothetical protein